jgi:multiple sugar transport system substrate-binding protein
MMKALRIAIRSFTDFDMALAAQLNAYVGMHPAVPIEVGRFDLRGLEDAVLGPQGLTGGGWDMAIFPTDWIGAAVASGALECLTPLMRDGPLPGWPQGWPASLREPLCREGEYYCIPWHDGPECLIYRKDLFDDPKEREMFHAKFARELGPPTTWVEFHEAARFFTRPSRDLYGTLFAAYPDGHNTLYDLTLQVWSRGGELYSNDGQPALESAAAIEALDYYRDVVNDESACFPRCAEIDSVHSGEVFLSGRIAFMVNWFGFAARCEQGGSPLRGKIGLAPIPGGRPGQTATLSNYWVIGIGSGSRQKRVSYELLRHIASAPMDKLTALHGAVGVRLSTWNDAEVRSRVPFYSQLESLSVRARTLPFCEDLPKLAEIVNQVTVEALHTNESSKSILQRAQEVALRQKLRLV